MKNFKCRACGSPEHEILLDLGQQPLANSLTKSPSPQEEKKIPLRLVICKKCKMLQISETVPPEELFTEYFYFSSFSDTMLAHAAHAARMYIDEYHLNASSLIIEIASNDGYMLQNFIEEKIPVLGIEPAKNISEFACKKGIPTLNRFYSCVLAKELADGGQQADLILANNVFAHVPEIRDFVGGLKVLLKPNGTAVIEFPYARDMIELGEFDTIYHEHVFYFTLVSLVPLFHAFDLEIYDCQRIDIHGGSLRIFIGNKGCYEPRDNVRRLMENEYSHGLDKIDYYQNFATRANQHKQTVISLLKDLKSSGKKIAAYGASAKGSTLLNWYQLGPDLIDYIVDRSPYKQGYFSPGMGIPILSPNELLKRMPDYILLLTWNFANEIIKQQSEYSHKGGKFIIPIPHLTIR